MPRLPLTLLLLAVPFLAPGQEPATPPEAVPAALAPEIERGRSALGNATGLDEPTRKAIETALNQAEADDQAADAALAEAARLSSDAAQTSSDLARLERADRGDVFTTLQAWRRQLPAEETLESLERRRETAQSELDRQRQDLAAINGALAETVTAPTSLIKGLRDQRQRSLAATEAARTAQAATGENGDLRAQARALAAQATARREAATLARMEISRQTLPERQRLLEARRRDTERRLFLTSRQLEFLDERLKSRRAEVVAERRAQLEADLAALTDAPELLRRVATENLDLSDRLVALEDELAQTRSAADATGRAATEADNALRTTQSRLTLGGSDEAVGLLLLQERRRLSDTARLAQRLKQVQRRMATIQLGLLELNDQADQLENLATEVERRLSDPEEAQTPPLTRQMQQSLVRLIGTRATLIPAVLDTTRRLSTALAEEENALQAQIATTRALNTLLEGKLLWVRSHGAIDLGWLQRQPVGWADLLKPARFLTTAKLFADSARAYWPVSAGIALLIVAIFWSHRRLPPMLSRWAQPLRHVGTDRYRYTLLALLATLLAAMPPALLVHGLAWLLRHAGDLGKYSDSLGQALGAVALTVYIYAFLGWLCHERGLARAHFRWTQTRRDALRALRPWLLWAVVPLQFLINLAYIRNLDPALDTAGRDLTIAWCLVVAWLIWRLLAPDGVWVGRGGDSEISRLRRTLRVLLPFGFLVLIGLALAGYLVTAGAIGRSVWFSGVLLLAVGVLHGLLSRWFLLGERRLALSRYLARREAGQAEERATGTGDAVPDSEPEEVTLQSVNTQTRRLLRALTVTVVAFGLLGVWSELLPALQRLDEVTLWTVSDVDANGLTISAAVTLRSLLFGLFALLLTVIAARNLPGLMELGLRSQGALDAPTRYAITSVSRYAIVIGGMVVGLSLLGLRWSQLQWMAAALTVGLGFGLQEIFANFVSGLIILFEKPYRVGDVVTIGEVEGTVTRIRTRATTVLDWDNKDVVIPNKMFITERFVNWTLSDAVTRVVLRIGVGYDSDPHEVRRLLLEIARGEPNVLGEPEPTCWFVQISASTFDFDLRVFVADVLHRNRVRNALHARIVEVFAEHGIEMAYAQMDVRFRTELALRSGEGAASAGEASASR